jgi:hypothetical protein
MILAEDAAMSAYHFIHEDGPVFPKWPGPHAEEGGEVMEGMHALDCSSPRDSRISGRAGGLDTVSGT